MATVAIEKVKVAPTPPLRAHRFTVEQYEQMGEIGVLTPNDRVELLEGWIVDKMTQTPPHNAVIDFVRASLETLLPQEWCVREQKAIRLTRSAPEPDLVVVQGPVSRYVRRHPTPEDIAIVIEVSDTTLTEDRTRKSRIYAQARIGEYWIVNLVESQLEVYTQPKGGKSAAYRDRQDYARQEAMPLVVAGRELGKIAVRDLFP